MRYLSGRGLQVAAALGMAVLGLGSPACAEMRPTLGFFGGTGLIDMPSGESQSDGVLSLTTAHFGPVSRNTLAFQILPRLSGSFRYTGIRDFNPGERTYYDRSFDLRYQLLRESRYLPAVTIGFQDIIGTGLLSGEYIAATKTFGGRVKVTAGLGWGRLASNNPIGAPFGVRPAIDFGVGGTLRLGQWFKGDVAPFAGIEWQVSDKLGLKAEYSSDAYAEEAGIRKIFERKSPFNFGLEYQYNRTLRLGAYYLYGSELGVSAQFVLDPRRRSSGGVLGAGPAPLLDRPLRAANAKAWSSQWVTEPNAAPGLRDALQTRLRADGIVIEAIEVTAGRVQLRIRNPRFDNGPQAIGRTARAMAAVLPASVEVFEIVPVVDGLAISKVVLRRTDLETLETAAGQDALIRERAQILPVAGGLPEGAVRGAGLYPKFTWGIGPYTKQAYFDPDNPLRIDVGVAFTGRYEISPGLVLSGTVTKKIIGNLDQSTRVSNSVLPHVRSDTVEYDREGNPAIDELTLAWFTKPAPNLYGRVTTGYLERMYGGVSAELLWKRTDRPYAFGVEINYVKQRDFNQLLGFRDYSIVTGHVSGYYNFNNGFLAQIDIGRYLAGDIGATLSIDREFANGWKIGAFATLTDVPFATFGEGSFDKGIRVEIPVTWLSGNVTRRTYANTVRPIQRDGGQRLSVGGRLYDTVREYHATRLDAEWGRFWR